MATSATGGYLPPLTPVDYDNALDDIFHGCIQGITAIAPTLVRPRWQPEPPNQPDFTVNWVAFGVMTLDADRFAYARHDPAGAAGLGTTDIERDERIKLLLSFYGPQASGYQARFAMGLQLSQNRDALSAAGIKLVEVQEAFTLPALFKEKWVKRVDSAVIFRRRVARSYAIQNVESSDVGLNNELYITPIEITNP